MRVSGLKEKELWDKERDAIFTSHSQAKTYNQQEAVALIQQYEDTKQQLILAGDMEKAIAQLNPVVDGLKHNLMKLEMTLVEQLDVSCLCVVIGDFQYVEFRRLTKSLRGTTLRW